MVISHRDLTDCCGFSSRKLVAQLPVLLSRSVINTWSLPLHGVEATRAGDPRNLRSTQPKMISELKETIQRRYGCPSLYVSAVQVNVPTEPDINWDGLVNVFELVGHAEAKRCYAWTHRDGDRLRKMTVLGIGPVTSAELAVKIREPHLGGS